MKLWRKTKQSAKKPAIKTYRKWCIDCDGDGYVIETHHKIPHDFPKHRKTIRLTELKNWTQPVYCYTCKGSGKL